MIFFFASAGASSAYLTVSEIFPLEVRAKAIAVFFAIAQCFGALGPVIYGALIGDGSKPVLLFLGYLLGAAVMIARRAGSVVPRRRRRRQVVGGRRDPARGSRNGQASRLGARRGRSAAALTVSDHAFQRTLISRRVLQRYSAPRCNQMRIQLMSIGTGT